jgi:hypothetical protein
MNVVNRSSSKRRSAEGDFIQAVARVLARALVVDLIRVVARVLDVDPIRAAALVRAVGLSKVGVSLLWRIAPMVLTLAHLGELATGPFKHVVTVWVVERMQAEVEVDAVGLVVEARLGRGIFRYGTERSTVFGSICV